MDGSRLRAFAADLGALVLPVDCAGCGTAGRTLCAACRRALEPAIVRRRVASLQVVSGLAYDGPAREVVLALKNHGRTDLAAPLAAALRAATREALEDDGAPVAAVPMPTTRRSRHERGFDPVRLLLRRAGLPHRGLLALDTLPRDQLLLGREGRLANLEGVMRASPAADGLRVLLVDDVVTTGATLREAARAMSAAGAQIVGAVTVAAVPLHASARSSRPHSEPGAIPAVAD